MNLSGSGVVFAFVFKPIQTNLLGVIYTGRKDTSFELHQAKQY